MTRKLPIVVTVLALAAIACWLYLAPSKAGRGATGSSGTNALTALPTPPAPPRTGVTAVPAVAPLRPTAETAVPPSLRGIVGLDPRLDFHGRLAAIHALGRDLSPAEVQCLGDFLQGQFDPPDPRGTTVLKNDLMDKLLEQRQPPPALVPLLIGLFRDPRQDIVLRDYAVQHLVSWAQEVGPQPAIEPVLWEALAETQSSLAGTALLGLHRLAAQDQTMDRARLAAAALRLAGDPKVGELARITALRVCGEVNVGEALPLALALAEKAPSVPLRIAALASLGELGGPSEVPFLQTVTNRHEPRLLPAAQSALRRLQQRHVSPQSQGEKS